MSKQRTLEDAVERVFLLNVNSLPLDLQAASDRGSLLASQEGATTLMSGMVLRLLHTEARQATSHRL